MKYWHSLFPSRPPPLTVSRDGFRTGQGALGVAFTGVRRDGQASSAALLGAVLAALFGVTKVQCPAMELEAIMAVLLGVVTVP